MQLQFLSSWWWAACRSKHVELLINIEIINSSKQLHLVGYFYIVYTMVHRSTYLKFKILTGYSFVSRNHIVWSILSTVLQDKSNVSFQRSDILYELADANDHPSLWGRVRRRVWSVRPFTQLPAACCGRWFVNDFGENVTQILRGEVRLG